ncbi:hypothetical protein [Nocardia sp. NPDC048505]|uniref:DUF6630 family protein n=1 Tax=unclassified Nocardia TaxID=2637762 RepID=UPI0033C994F0
MELVQKEIIAAAEVLLDGRPELIEAVRRAATGLPGEGFDIPASEWESLARHELNHWLTDPAPFDGGSALTAHLDWAGDAESLRRGLQTLSSHPESLSWDWFPEFEAFSRESGWSAGEVAEKLVAEIGDRCLQIGAALVELTETRSSGNDDMYELIFIDSNAVDQLAVLSAVLGRRVVLCRSH